VAESAETTRAVPLVSSIPAAPRVDPMHGGVASPPIASAWLCNGEPGAREAGERIGRFAEQYTSNSRRNDPGCYAVWFCWPQPAYERWQNTERLLRARLHEIALWACSLGWNVATHYRPFHCSRVSGVGERAPRTEFIERVELRPQLRRPFAPTPALHNTAWLSVSDSASRDSARRARASKARSMAWPIRERQTAPTPASRRAWSSSLCKVPYRVVLVAAIIADANSW